MKCNDCGRRIDPRRGYCTFFKCHNKAIGGPTPDPGQQRARAKTDGKRCPYCTGEYNGRGTCFVSSCDRGPNKTPCGCHFLMAGMGSPGPEMRATLQVKHVDVMAGGGARVADYQAQRRL